MPTSPLDIRENCFLYVLSLTFVSCNLELTFRFLDPRILTILQESISSVQEAGSSLVPPLAPEVAAVVKEVMIRVLHITSDPDFGELNTSRQSLTGNTIPNRSHHRSLDTLPLTRSSTKEFLSTTESVENAEQDNKKLFPRTLSNMVCRINTRSLRKYCLNSLTDFICLNKLQTQCHAL